MSRGIYVSGRLSMYVPKDIFETHLWKFCIGDPMKGTKAANMFCYPWRPFILHKIMLLCVRHWLGIGDRHSMGQSQERERFKNSRTTK